MFTFIIDLPPPPSNSSFAVKPKGFIQLFSHFLISLDFFFQDLGFSHGIGVSSLALWSQGEGGSFILMVHIIIDTYQIYVI